MALLGCWPGWGSALTRGSRRAAHPTSRSPGRPPAPDREPGTDGDAHGNREETERVRRSRCIEGDQPARGSSASWERSDGTASNVLPPRPRPRPAGDQDGVEYDDRYLATADHGDERQPRTRRRSRWSSSRRRSPTSSWRPHRGSGPVLQGDQTSYQVNVTRTAGFNGPVNLSVAGLPNGATASWNPSHTVPGPSSTTALQIGTRQRPNRKLRPDDHRSGTVGGNAVSRSPRRR